MDSGEPVEAIVRSEPRSWLTIGRSSALRQESM